VQILHLPEAVTASGAAALDPGTLELHKPASGQRIATCNVFMRGLQGHHMIDILKLVQHQHDLQANHGGGSAAAW
jgi:hypothetical protein